MNTRILTFRVRSYINHANADLPGIFITASRISDDLFGDKRTIHHDEAVANVLFVMSAKDRNLQVIWRDRTTNSVRNHTYTVKGTRS